MSKIRETQNPSVAKTVAIVFAMHFRRLYGSPWDREAERIAQLGRDVKRLEEEHAFCRIWSSKNRRKLERLEQEIARKKALLQ